jgi:hypothetical protein
MVLPLDGIKKFVLTAIRRHSAQVSIWILGVRASPKGYESLIFSITEHRRRPK